MVRHRWIAVLVAASLASFADCWAPVTVASSPTQISSGTDTTAPTFALGFPGRGEFVSGPAQVTIVGTADDAESGVAVVEVNGQSATLQGSAWSIPATLEFGINIFTLRVVDNQGNVAHTSWSAVYSPTYLPENQLVENSSALRLSERTIGQVAPLVVNALTSSGALQAAIAAALETSLGGAQINSLSFGSPQVSVALAQNGFRTMIDIPNLAVDATVLGVPVQISATNAHVDAVLLVTVSNGAFTASVTTAPTVTFTDFASNLIGSDLAEQLLAMAIQTAVPPALQTALDQTTQPSSFTYSGVTMTVEGRPRSLMIDPANLRAYGDANVIAPPSPTAPAAPGSPSRHGATSAAPTFTTPRDISIAIREDFVNRTLVAVWQSGATGVRIDQAFLAAQGINLPFRLDASLLYPFFPALASLNPGGGPVPLAFAFNPQLPPVAEVTGGPSLLVVGVGELHLSVLLDLGDGFVDILTVRVHAELGTSLAVQNGELRIVPGQPSRLEADVLANPLGLSAPDVERFLQTAVPLTVGLAGLPPIPLPLPPSLLDGLRPTSIDFRQDGAGGDFVTIEGDLRRLPPRRRVPGGS